MESSKKNVSKVKTRITFLNTFQHGRGVTKQVERADRHFSGPERPGTTGVLDSVGGTSWWTGSSALAVTAPTLSHASPRHANRAQGKILCRAISPVPCKDRTGARQTWTGLGPKPSWSRVLTGNSRTGELLRLVAIIVNNYNEKKMKANNNNNNDDKV